MEVKEVLILLGLIATATAQSCMPPFVPVGGNCLHVEYSEQGNNMTWQEARDYCKALGSTFNSDLASFPTCDEYTAFSRYMAFNVPSNISYWVGVHTLFTSNSWQWVTLEGLQTGVPFWYHNSYFQEGNECGAADGNYYFRLVPEDCSAGKSFACSYNPEVTTKEVEIKEEKLAECPNGAIYIGGICYVFKDKTATFASAEDNCRSEHGHIGGELYFPSSCDEFTQIAHHLEATEDFREYWVGAIDVSGQDEWTWVTGGLLPGGPPYWATGEPSHDHANEPKEHCATMTHDRRFYLTDKHCSDPFYYICKLPSG